MSNVERIGSTAIARTYSGARLFKRTTPKPLMYNDGNHIVNGVKMNRFTNCAFETLDKLTPFFEKHSKIGQIIVSATEKFIKFTGSI